MRPGLLFRWFAVLLLGFFFLSTLASDQPDIDSRVKELFAPWESRISPGCSVAVIRDGSFIFKESFGMADLEHGVPLAPDSMFYACSVSKQFVSMCVLLLEEEGKLSLDDNIRKFLPEFPDYGNPITIRHLLHHTSGIRDYFSLWEMAGNDFQDYMPPEAVYEMILRQKDLNFLPGEDHMYSNSCYFLIYRIIEKVSGKTLREYARENIFQPLGMKNSFFHDDYSRIIKNRAMGYYPSEEFGFVNMISRFDLVGSGGMFTCVEDFLSWDNNFYNNRLGKNDPGMIQKMITTGKLNDGRDAGYALALVPGSYRGLDIIEHSGSLGGYRTHYLRFPEQRFSVVILSNLSSFDPKSRTREIADIYLEENLGKPEKSDLAATISSQAAGESAGEKKSGPVALSKSEIDKFSGRFYSEELECAYSLKIDDDNLLVNIRYRPAIKLISKGNGVFEGPQLIIRFLEKEPGKALEFHADSGGAKGIVFVKE